MRFVRTRRGRVGGFTLIELMVTVAVVAIIAVVAVPNLVSLVQANRISSLTDEMSASLQHARSEAIRRNAQVTVCRSADGASCAGEAGAWDQWVVLAPDIDGSTDVLQAHAARASVQITGSNDSITFRPSGVAVQALILTTCIPTDDIDENQRQISVLVSGLMTTTSREGAGECPDS